MKFAFPNLLSREEFWLAASAVAVGLVVAWILRGAAPGQAGKAEDDAEAPRSGYRDRMIAGVIVGLLLIAGGGYFALSRGILLSVPVFALGFGLVIFLIARNRRYRHASPTMRRTIDFSTAFLNASLLGGILIVGNVIAFRYGSHPLDLTREGTYTLSSETTKELHSLDRTVKFTLFFGQGARASRQRDRVVQLLESYKSTNPDRVELDSLDPFNDVTRYEELAKRVPELELLHGGGVVIEYGKQEGAPHAVVRNQDLFLAIPLDPARQGRDRYATTFSGEDEITTALMRLKEGQKTKVAFTVGHGEPSTADLNPRGRGIGNWKARFNKVGCDVLDLNLLSDEIPPDLTLLIVVGPKVPFRPDEILKLRSFTDRGKPLLLLLGNSEPSGLDEFLKSFNLSIGKGLIVDPRFSLRGNASLVYAPTEPALKHEIVDAVGENRAVLLPGAAPIDVAGAGNTASAGAPVDPTLVPFTIVRTTKSSWAESEPRKIPLSLDPKTEKAGPLPVGIAVSESTAQSQPGAASGGKPRLVLFSCPAMAENIFQDIERTNLDMLMIAAGWLRARSDTLGIPPHPHVALRLSVDPELRNRLILVPSVVALMLIIAMGIIVFTARRE
jgi:ABC-type uncharacterized transport system